MVSSKKDEMLEKLPGKLVDTLMPFQKDGVKFAIEKNGRCLIADEMGLGKTIQAISVAYYYREEWPLLIIVPSSLRYSWIEEFEKWLPDIDPGDINLVQSGNDISDIDKSQITVTTFGLLSKSTSRILREALMAQDFKVVIVDESHYIRNSKTVSAKTVVPLVKKANRRILLSGTPALSRPVELYPQIDAICPEEFGSWWTYTAKFCDAKIEWIGKIRKRNVNGASNLVELQQKLSNLLMIRREKSEVLTQLPPKQRQRVLFELKDSDLKKEIRQTFDELRPLLKRSTEEKFEVLTGAGEHDAKDTNTLSLIQRLYRLSGEAKIGPAKEYVEMLCENPNLKFLVFAYHHNMMNALSESLHDKKVKFIRIDGETPPSERPHLVHKFQSDPDIRVAVLSILAAGVGLTFTAATVVVFAEMYWTPGTMVQCEDRAHRIGQTSCVAVHYLVARGTMDEWVWSAVCKKTLVTSTTLTGKKRKLEALEGDKYQVDVLSNAEVWVPTSDPGNSSITEYFETSLDTGQKSILSFFSSSTKSAKRQNVVCSSSSSNNPTKFDEKLKTVNSPTVSLSVESDSYSTPPNKRIKLDSKLQSMEPEVPSSKKMIPNHVIVIDSDGEDFVDDDKRLKSSSKKTVRNSQKKGSVINSLKKSPKNSIQTLFDNSKHSVPRREGSKQKDKHLLPLHDSEIEKGGNTWNCEACTYLNHSEIVYCEICDTPKKGKTDKTVANSRSKSSTSVSKKSKSGVHECIRDKNKTNRNILDDSSGGINEAIFDETEAVTDNNVNMKSDDDISNVKDLLEEKEDPLAGLDSFDNEIDSNVEDSKVLESTAADVCNTESDKSMSVNVTPVSAKKYHFKSVKRDKNSESRKYVDIKLNLENVKEKNDDIKSDVVILNSSPDEVSEEMSGHKVAQSNVSVADHGQVVDMGSQDVDMKSQDVGAGSQDTGAGSQNGDVGSQDVDMKSQDYSLSSSEIDDMPASEADCVAKKTCDDTKVVDLDTLPVHPMFKYQCSKYTDRIYLLTKDEEPLHVNFIPTDVQFRNEDGIPDILFHPDNLKLVQRFIREWTSLTETKRRLIIKSGQPFISPLQEYEKLKSCKVLNTQRHRSKNDTANRACQKAAEINGTVRTISKQTGSTSGSSNSASGVTQAIAEDGTPLCLQCFQPFTSQLVKKSSVVDEDNAWNTRFCTRKCSQDYWMVSNNDYMRDHVFEAEHGVCQLCQYDAHSLFKRVRDCQDHMKRAEIISGSKFRSLTVKVKQQMVTKPVAGQFWHVDHIKPVWEGGGQCDIDNLRTLCVICHQKITASQASKRATVKKLGAAVNAGDISAFFLRN